MNTALLDKVVLPWVIPIQVDGNGKITHPTSSSTLEVWPNDLVWFECTSEPFQIQFAGDSPFQGGNVIDSMSIGPTGFHRLMLKVRGDADIKSYKYSIKVELDLLDPVIVVKVPSRDGGG